MIDKSKRLDRNQIRSSTSLSAYALLVGIIELFGKKPPQDNLAHLKQWEREKVIELGLAIHPPRQARSAIKEIGVNSWGREKVTHFDLAESHSHKKSHRNILPAKQKSTPAEIKLESQPKKSTFSENEPENLHTNVTSPEIRPESPHKKPTAPKIETKLLPKKTPSPPPGKPVKKQPEQVVFKNDKPPIDDFFKILGYE